MRSSPPDTARCAAELRQRLADRLAAGEIELPMLPETAVRTLALCSDPDCDPRELSELLHGDPALAGRTLRVANSAAHAPCEPVGSLPQAVGRLGLRTVGEIAFACAVESRLYALPRHAERLRASWADATTAAAWAREVARWRRRDVEGAFLAGLLHDVGRPTLLAAIGGEDPGETELDLVLEELHAVVGARVLASWSMPAWMVAAVRCHHDPELAGEHVEEARTAALACRLAEASARPDADPDAPLGPDPLPGRLGIYPDELAELWAAREGVLARARSLQ